MKPLHQIILQEYFEPAIGRAVRVTLAFVVPLIWGLLTGHMGEAVWIALTAQLLSNVLIPGSYPLKILILSGATLAAAVCAMLGKLAGHCWLVATLLMMVLAFLGGFVRQTGNFGPGITISVLLLYLLTLDHPGNRQTALHLFAWVSTGGLLAIGFTVLAWAFVPFSPFRRSVALVWKALADWLHAFYEQQFQPHAAQPDVLNPLDEHELSFRQAMSDSMEWLSRKQALARARLYRQVYQLVELRRIASQVAQSLAALRTTTESYLQQDSFPKETFSYLLDNLSRTAERLALSIISHRREHVYFTRIGLERSRHSAELWLEQLKLMPSSGEATEAIRPILDALFHQFEEALQILETWIPSRTDFTLFLRQFITSASIPQTIPWVRFPLSFQSFIFRYALRLSLSMGIGVAVYLWFHIPHGYWLAMTTMIVLQPEFGATLQKASQRVQGTLGGVIVGSLLFWLHLPLVINLGIVALCSFLMAYFIQRRYAIAAFFITIMVIALFHLLEPVTWQLGLIRLLVTLAGSALALLGGYAFWPYWEKYRFPALIRQAIAANAAYLQFMADALAGPHISFQQLLPYRRKAEISNQNAFLSLRRMQEEPETHQQFLQNYFILLGYQIRITRLLNTLAQYLRQEAKLIPTSAANGWQKERQALQSLHKLLIQAAEMMPETSDLTISDASAIQQQKLYPEKIYQPDEKNKPLQLIQQLVALLVREVEGTYQMIRSLQSADSIHLQIGSSIHD
ncbi:putative membrane protein YccC [Thermoflavifilum aggregans]|uniref:Putative membrane protein YccC n=1 Tax=Thermoflavifilum aggregans TaxID=454188 RepID=A0A2M9CUK8_9BACT|nr:FUSC family protein [Thermoflavifilum aggregans]PJJ75606.1 putative membrane protein YccC [Thermoflavifilum aggregans]